MDREIIALEVMRTLSGRGSALSSEKLSEAEQKAYDTALTILTEKMNEKPKA